MHRVGLCIVHRNHNYGGVLQSYATLMKMDELGVSYEIIDYKHPQNLDFYLRALPNLANRVTVYSKLRSLRKKIGTRLHREFAANARIRAEKFNEFLSDHFVKLSKPIRDYAELQQFAVRYTDILVGSDQLWLPSGLGTNFYNLLFAPDNCNKIAYASSFGVSVIPENQKKKTREYLSRIQHISVRETAGQKIIEELTGRRVPVILDPTMIVTKAQWDQAIEDREIVPHEYIFCYFLGNNPSQRREVEKLAREKGLKIVTLRHIDEYIPGDEQFGDIAPYDVGPAEFVNLIRHASYICTDSFHGSVFSVLYHKQFISFNRFASGSNSRNSRLDTLFANIGISRRFSGDILREMDEAIDYEAVEERISALRAASHAYIVDALGLTAQEREASAPPEESFRRICPEGDCTGCTACSAACPVDAIAMKMDRDGFCRPAIDPDRCIDCGRCERFCPVRQAPQTHGPTKAFAFQNSDAVRFDSTSGGFFHALACRVIEEGGVVCGAAFDENMVLRHSFAERKEDLAPLQRSKYVQSSLDGVFRKIKAVLGEGRKVLFVGVGCQAAALRKYIGEDENLILADVVCYGAPSPGLFRDWIAWLEKTYGKVTDVRFRDKSYGYASPNVKVLFENGRHIEACRDSNLYTNLFFRHLSIRSACYRCRFKTLDRASDLTLGDLWSIGKYDAAKDDNKGSTVVFSHTPKGEALCRALCSLELDAASIVAADARKMLECVTPARGVSGFWQKYREDGFQALTELYERNTAKSRLKYTVKTMMNKTGLSYIWYRRAKRKALEHQ